jgi:superfamily II DNA or RNA helicase
MSCEKIMCKYGLNDKSLIRDWLKINHPDKGGNMDRNEFIKVLECYKNNVTCTAKKAKSDKAKNDKTKGKTSTTKNTRKKRAKIFTCMRKTANFSKILNYHKFDKTLYEPKKLNEELVEASPKMVQLLNNIRELDAQDVKYHNKKFKHFIFSDVKEGGYGAKIIASALQANGYNNILKSKKVSNQINAKLYLDIEKSNYQNFALLSSNSVYGTTFNEKIKKETLKMYNERPANIHGKNVRLIVLDSGFKEGIDLFDVKYVHIFEPSITIADLKQTVGRATRTCGQKGLEFQKNIGWPLYVYNYYLTIPEITSDSMYVNRSLMENNFESYNKDEDVLLFKNVEKYNDSTMNYSEFDSAMIQLSKQLYELAPLLAVDYYLTKNIHKANDLNREFMEKDFYLMGGARARGAGARTRKAGGAEGADEAEQANEEITGGAGEPNFKKQSDNSKFFKIDNIKCMGKCGKKSTNDIPVSIDFMKYVYKKYNHPKQLLINAKANVRQFLCNYMKDLDNKFCKHVNLEWSQRYIRIPHIIEKHSNLLDIKKDLQALELVISAEDDATNIKYPMILYKTSSRKIIPRAKTVSIRSNSNKTSNKTSNKSSKKHRNYKFTKMSFIKMRDYIITNYNSKEFVWEPIDVVNKCVDAPKANASSANSITLNPTQTFIADYFTPASPYKGILLWHSVGTGKTCTGVATASSSFEKEGYSILWVTRTTLKGDVWKNIFDQICHVILVDEINKGLILPENLSDRKRHLSKSWLEPMSYKQFSNLLAGKNAIYDILLERNGSRDLLHKTLIIIDEAHKLYGGDLKASERPNMEIMENLISNSYKVSGAESCKLMIMTATPFTNSPLELFALTNLFMTHESEKITTNKEEFKKQYMTSQNILSETGLKVLANKLSGYISYLNREKDPTQFAQPIMINVPILMSHVENEDLRDAVYLNANLNSIEKDIEELIVALRAKIKEEKADYKSKKLPFKNKEIPQHITDELDAILKNIKSFEDKINGYKQNKADAKDKMKELKDKVRAIKNSLLQEYILYTKCMHIKYKNVRTQKKYKLLR